MPPERRRLVVLLAVLGLVSVIAAYRLWPETATPGVTQSNGRGGTAARGPSEVAAPDVHLQVLREDRPEPETGAQRDLFRFKPRAAPARPTAPPQAPAAAVNAPPAGPPPPPPLAPITMRFIGLVESPEHAQKIAILSDGRGVYQGREGDIIEGRYRILRIGVESVEIAYLDGRGRQTIRLSGS
jgi:hypothetical protein